VTLSAKSNQIATQELFLTGIPKSLFASGNTLPGFQNHGRSGGTTDKPARSVKSAESFF
jgi:hypothetical protein